MGVAPAREAPRRVRSSRTLSGITTVDPLEYQLPFERFLNPERPSPPDIDMDSPTTAAMSSLIMCAQYGDTHVAQIGTFGTMMARAAVRDVAGARSSLQSRRYAREINSFGKQGFPVSIQSSLESVPELAAAKKKRCGGARGTRPRGKNRRQRAARRRACLPASSSRRLPSRTSSRYNWDPKGGKIITQYDMHAVEDAGLLKFDFLGLTNLSVLADAVARVCASASVSA